MTRQETIRQELEATRTAYHELLTTTPDEMWEMPTSNPSWNVRQVLFHIILAHKFLPQDMKLLRSGRMFTPPKQLFDRLNDWYTRWAARNQNRQTLVAEFDKAHNNILHVLDTVQEEEWELSGTYPDINENLAGERTIADMFHYLTVHFWEHEAEIRGIMTQNNTFEQKANGLMRYPQDGWRKAMWKAPIQLWRLGMAPVIGNHTLLMTQTGRKSGLPRRTMIEYHHINGTKYAPCAFGEKAHWYKNIVADPRVTIQSAHGVESVTAVRISDDQEILDVYELFKRRDPPLLNWYINSLDIQHNHSDIIAKKDRIYWVRFDPTPEPTPPPLDEDLKWVWVVTAVSLITLWLLSKFSRKSG